MYRHCILWILWIAIASEIDEIRFFPLGKISLWTPLADNSFTTHEEYNTKDYIEHKAFSEHLAIDLELQFANIQLTIDEGICKK